MYHVVSCRNKDRLNKIQDEIARIAQPLKAIPHDPVEHI